jgi:hypothetical protein
MSIRPLLLLVALAACTASGGCAKWSRPKLDLSRWRDPRAVDIDGRLSAPPLDFDQRRPK